MPNPYTANGSISHFSNEGGLTVTDNQRRSDSEPDREEAGGGEPGERSQLIKGMAGDLDGTGDHAAVRLLIQLRIAFAMLPHYLDQEDQSEERNFLLFLAQSLLREMHSELRDIARSD